MPSQDRTETSLSHFINPHRLFHGVWLPQWLEERPEVSEKAKKLYAYLTYFAGGKGYAWPSFNHLAEKLHVSRRYVIKLVQELSAHRLITVTNVNNPAKGHCTNYYRFLWHPWMQTAEDGDFRMAVREEQAPFPPRSLTRSHPLVNRRSLPLVNRRITSPGEPQITPLVIPSSPKENNKKRINYRGKVPVTSSSTSPSKASSAASPPPKALVGHDENHPRTANRRTANGDRRRFEARQPRQERTSFTANSLPTKRLLDSHRTIHHRSLRPLGRKNLAIRLRCPIGPHLRKSGEPLTSFAAHWDGRSKDENL